MPRGQELIVILIVIAVLFGAKRLPDSARSLGRSLRIFKSEMKEMKDDDKKDDDKKDDDKKDDDSSTK